MLEHTVDRSTYRNFHARISKKITDDPGSGRFIEVHQRDQIGALLSQRGVNGMPDALIAVEVADRRDFLKRKIETMALVAQPLRAPLPVRTRIASLNQQCFVLQSCPECSVQPI